MFIHAYEGAAFAMHRLTGYKVRLVHRKKGDIRMLGFQATQLENVKNLMAEAGITLRDEAQGLWSFEGGDTTEIAVDAPVTQPAGKPQTSNESQAANEPLLDVILGYNLAASTPMEAMLFLSDLQRRYGK